MAKLKIDTSLFNKIVATAFKIRPYGLERRRPIHLRGKKIVHFELGTIPK